MGAPLSDGAERVRQRRAMIESLSRLHPEFVWIDFADRPGRVAVAQRDLLAGADVSGRDGWDAALRSPYLGDVHEARLLAPARIVDARPGAVPGEPPRLLDGALDGALDDRPRTFSVHPVDGDVVVARLGWIVAVGRDPAVHEAPARRFLGWSIAAGAVIGALGAIAVAVASGAGSRRAAA